MNSGSFEQITTSWLIEKTGGLIKLEVYASRKSLTLALFQRAELRVAGGADQDDNSMVSIRDAGAWEPERPKSRARTAASGASRPDRRPWAFFKAVAALLLDDVGISLPLAAQDDPAPPLSPMFST